jgi:SAM-dependent methyltransferase
VKLCSEDVRRQREHYDALAPLYLENLGYPHTEEYTEYLDDVFLELVGEETLGTAAELCCGQGEALRLLGRRVERGVGVDVSLEMLKAGATSEGGMRLSLLQADATRLPLADASLDSVVMLGGIHHVSDRRGLFREVARILRPGGRFLWREPVSDFFLWRWLRAVIYRLSPALDHQTERPLRYDETETPLREVGLTLRSWRTCGFLGFCLLMNSDVLVVNRLLRFVPGIRAIARFAARFDAWCLRLPGFSRAGLQVVGCAEKPA